MLIAFFFFSSPLQVFISHIECSTKIIRPVYFCARFFGLVNYLLGQLVEKAGLSGMDRIMGMAFGALRGVLIVAVLILVLREFTPVQQDRWWQKSQLIPHVEQLSNWFYEQVDDVIPGVTSRLPVNVKKPSN